MPSIQVIRIVAEAFGFVNRESRTLVAIIVLPLALNVVLIVGFAVIDGGSDVGWLMVFVRNIVALVIYVPFFTAWHRLTLLGPQRAGGVIGYVYRGAESRYLGLLLLAYLFFLVGSFLGSAVIIVLVSAGDAATAPLMAAMLSLALTLILTYVLTRWSMVFPAASVGERLGFNGSWGLTRGNGLRIFATIVLIAIPLVLIGMATIGVVGLESALGEGQLVLELVMLVPGFYIGAVIVSALSMIYWHLTGYDPDGFRAEAIARR